MVKRDGEEKEFKLSLDEVEIESVTSKVFEQNKKKIGYIDISVFLHLIQLLNLKRNYWN